MTWYDLTRLLRSAPGNYSACLWDGQGRQIYGYDEHTVCPAASLAKVPLAMAIYGDPALACPGVDLDFCITLCEADRVEGLGSIDTAPAGTSKTVRELVAYMLIESDNTAANLLLQLLGWEDANRLVEALGLQTRIRRKFMDFDALAADRDNTTTAWDMCALFHRLLQPAYTALIDDLLRTAGASKLEAGIPPSVPIAHKVGDLPRVEHDAGIVFAPDRLYIVAVLAVGLPDIESGRQTIAEASRMIWRENRRTTNDQRPTINFVRA